MRDNHACTLPDCSACCCSPSRQRPQSLHSLALRQVGGGQAHSRVHQRAWGLQVRWFAGKQLASQSCSRFNAAAHNAAAWSPREQPCCIAAPACSAKGLPTCSAFAVASLAVTASLSWLPRRR